MTKKKTVKELHTDVQVLETKVEQLEKFKEIFEKLSRVDLSELEKKLKIIDDAKNDPKMQNIEMKVKENSLILKKLMSKQEERKFPCKQCNSTFADKGSIQTHQR